MPEAFQRLMPSVCLLILFLLLHSTITVCTQNNTTSFHMEGFANENLTLTNSSVILPNGLLRLAGNDSNQLGHAFFPNPLNLKSSTSFSTTFVFAMVYPSNVSDHGMAFALSPSPNLPSPAPNENLDLFSGNSTRNKHIFAVELDTIKVFNVRNYHNHVGINVDGFTYMSASDASYIDENGEQRILDLDSGKSIQVWIDYNASNSSFGVTLAPLRVRRPEFFLFSAEINLSSILTDETYVGFSAFTGGARGHHYLLGWSFSMDGEPLEELDPGKLPRIPSDSQRLRSSLAIMALVFGVLVVI